MNEVRLVQDLQRGKIGRREFITRATALGLSFGSIAAVLQACGGGSGGTTGGTVNLKWSVWGNPGELKRFYDFTDDFNKKNPGIHAELISIPNATYETKLLTSLNGGTAPDIFYLFDDGSITKYIQTGQVLDLTSRLSSSQSQVNPDDIAPGLWGSARTTDNKIYALPPDCNPFVLWYNKQVLRSAGVTQMPSDLYTQGTWNWGTFLDILKKVHATGKYGFILDAWQQQIYSWVTANGGQIYADNGSGDFVGNTDPKAVEAFKWLASNMKAGYITYQSLLSKGQGDDLLFMTNQVAFVSAGRWYLPEFSKSQGLEYDIVPYPTNTGKKLEPVGVAGAYVAINSKTKYPDQAFQFLSAYISKSGQTFRLQGAGNAVPSIKGVDQLVLDGNLPEHAQYFLDARNIGGYTELVAENRVPGLGTDVQTDLEAIWLQGADVQQTLDKIAAKANAKLAQAKA